MLLSVSKEGGGGRFPDMKHIQSVSTWRGRGERISVEQRHRPHRPPTEGHRPQATGHPPKQPAGIPTAGGIYFTPPLPAADTLPTTTCTVLSIPQPEDV